MQNTKNRRKFKSFRVDRKFEFLLLLFFFATFASYILIVIFSFSETQGFTLRFYYVCK
jgi:hypothetical protein